MKKAICSLIALSLLLVTPALFADEGEESQEWKAVKQEAKRQKIDEAAADALDLLFGRSPKSREIYEGAHGYAVFDNFKLAFVLSGGGGVGVAVQRDSEDKTYMKMGTGGIGLGLGGQKYQVVLFFQDSQTFQTFVDKGWQADATAAAAAGTAGADARAGFVNGLAVYQITESGLMANADISGTKYWKYKKLNE